MLENKKLTGKLQNIEEKSEKRIAKKERNSSKI